MVPFHRADSSRRMIKPLKLKYKRRSASISLLRSPGMRAISSEQCMVTSPPNG